MSQETFRFILNCDVDTYWKLVFQDPEYFRRVYAEALRFREATCVSQEDRGETIVRKLRLNPPPTELPGPVAKVIGDLSYVENGVFTKKENRFRVSVTPASLPDKTTISGEIWCEPRGDKQIEFFAKMTVEVKVFMVGGLVEKYILADMKKGYETSNSFTNAYLKEKGL